MTSDETIKYLEDMVDLAVQFGANRSRAEREMKECFTFEMNLKKVSFNLLEQMWKQDFKFHKFQIDFFAGTRYIITFDG